jgi:hypothetical protein
VSGGSLGEPTRYSRWAFRDVELPDSEVLEVRVSSHLLENVCLGVAFHGLAVLPEVDATVGVGLRVGQPGLGDEARQLGEGGGSDISVCSRLNMSNHLPQPVAPLAQPAGGTRAMLALRS